MRKFTLASLFLCLVFSLPLYQLTTFALQSSLYSHIVLIPFISLYLVWQRRAHLPAIASPDRPLAILFFVIGLAPLLGFGLAVFTSTILAREDRLALTMLSLLGFFVSTSAWFLGRPRLRALTFPLAFLVFMIPWPVFFVTWIENLLQHGSAAVAQALFILAGTTVFVDQLVFQLPGITLQVAPECSGIHSSLALLITSILAGYFFLRSPVKRTLLALAVLPLALLRNGLRVFVLGELCVRVGPEMINSSIHHHGGPYFFLLSLIPFALLLRLLFRLERKPRTGEAPNRTTPLATTGD